jgi:competence protein ComEA
MTKLFTRTNLTWFFLAAIVCGAVAIIWILATANVPPTNAVLIERAGAGSVGSGRLGINVSSADDPAPTATRRTLQLEGGATVEIAGGKSAIAQITPGTILGAPTPTPATVTVYVSGAVAQPGVYTLAEGARVQDAIAAAGGAMIQANLDGLNLAQKLTDEAHIVVGRRDDGTPSSLQQPAASIGAVPNAPAAGQSLSQPAGPEPTPAALIDINTATAAELEALPGVGPSLAARIVTDRDKYGPFRSVEDLTRVSGIKEGILSRIRAYITVGE